MGSLIRCIYSSVATADFNEETLPQLLGYARTANAKRAVTGMLVYINGNFLQVVEGEKEAIDDLIGKISRDTRHKRVSLLVHEPIAARSFSDWSMGFEAILPADVGDIIGENDFFDSGTCLSSLDAGLVKTILLSFHKSQTESA